MVAIVVMMCGITASSGANAEATLPTRPAPAADTGRAFVGTAIRMPSSALAARRLVRPAGAILRAPAALSGTISAQDYATYEYGLDDGWIDEECEPCHEHHSCRCWRCCVRSTCDMIPHPWYYPDSHGYYYFRPYNYAHVQTQQEFIKSIGGDPRNPYADGLFEKIYAELQQQ